MESLLISKELFDFIFEECEKFRERTGHGVNVEDVLFSYFNSTDKDFHILNDWDEGENNDPYWNKERNEHSAIVFLKDICKKIGLNCSEQ